ncbi:MAG TPA: DUF4190 domain-containing protein [Phycisphaerales bacterium]|nr:DUF4190 domain-containing protein [Phycisphaerales bacterium]
MSNFHQAGFSDFGTQTPPPAFDQARRLSALAVSSIITGVVSIVGCCVPALGALPVLLGIAGLVVVQRSRGALSGRGLAIGGIVLGLLSLIVSTGIWIGISAGGNKLGPVYTQAFSADPAVVRSVLDSDAAAQVSDERIAEFQAQMASDLGGAPAIPQGVGPLFRAFGEMDQDDAERVAAGAGSDVIPMPGKTPQGQTIVLLQLSDDEVMGSWFPRVSDAGYVAPDGSLVWLIRGSSPAENASPAPTPADEQTDPPAPDPGG